MLSLLSDHTGLHGAGRCLDGTARDQDDIKDLLNLAMQIVFTNDISFIFNEAAFALERSDEIISKVLNISGQSASKPIIKVAEITKYHDLATDIGDRLGQQLSQILNESSSLNGFLSDLYKEPDGVDNAGLRHEDFFLKIPYLTDKNRKNIQSQAKDNAGADLHIYTVVSSDILFEAIKDYQKTNTWTVNSSRALNHLIRYAQYQSISSSMSDSKNNKSITARYLYSPSPARANVAHNISQNIFKTLSSKSYYLHERIIQSDSAKSDEEPLDLEKALIHAGKGEPLGIIEEALELRHTAIPLRKRILKAGRAKQPLTAIDIEISNIQIEFSDLLRRRYSSSLLTNIGAATYLSVMGGTLLMPILGFSAVPAAVAAASAAVGAVIDLPPQKRAFHWLQDNTYKARSLSALTQITENAKGYLYQPETHSELLKNSFRNN